MARAKTPGDRLEQNAKERQRRDAFRQEWEQGDTLEHGRLAILAAARNGYLATADGRIISKRTRHPIKISPAGQVRLYSLWDHKHSPWAPYEIMVSAARFVAYFMFGERALDRNVYVNCLDGNRANVHPSNLRLDPLTVRFEKSANTRARNVGTGKPAPTAVVDNTTAVVVRAAMSMGLCTHEQAAEKLGIQTRNVRAIVREKTYRLALRRQRMGLSNLHA